MVDLVASIEPGATSSTSPRISCVSLPPSVGIALCLHLSRNCRGGDQVGAKVSPWNLPVSLLPQRLPREPMFRLHVPVSKLFFESSNRFWAGSFSSEISHSHVLFYWGIRLLQSARRMVIGSPSAFVIASILNLVSACSFSWIQTFRNFASCNL